MSVEEVRTRERVGERDEPLSYADSSIEVSSRFRVVSVVEVVSVGVKRGSN